MFVKSLLGNEVIVELKGDWSLTSSVGISMPYYFSSISLNGTVENKKYKYVIADSIEYALLKATILDNGQVMYEQDIVYEGKDVWIELNLKEYNIKTNWRGDETNEQYQKIIFKQDSLSRRLQTLRQLSGAYPNKNSDFYPRTVEIMNNARKELSVFYEEVNKEKQSIKREYALASLPYVPQTSNSEKEQVEEILEHFFDYYNPLSDPIFNSKFFKNKLDEYMGLVLKLARENDELNETVIIKWIDVFLLKTIDNEYAHDETANYLWERIYRLSLDKVIQHIDMNYLSQQCDASGDIKLQTRLEAYQRLAIGVLAPQFSWIVNEKEEHLTDIQSEKTVLIFWATWCGHCKETLPTIKKFLSDKQGVKTIAIALDDNETEWKNEIVKYPEWINIQAKEKWENKIVRDYAIYATPTIYILDEDKKIIEKAKNLLELQKFI